MHCPPLELTHPFQAFGRLRRLGSQSARGPTRIFWDVPGKSSQCSAEELLYTRSVHAQGGVGHGLIVHGFKPAASRLILMVVYPILPSVSVLEMPVCVSNRAASAMSRSCPGSVFVSQTLTSLNPRVCCSFCDYASLPLRRMGGIQEANADECLGACELSPETAAAVRVVSSTAVEGSVWPVALHTVPEAVQEARWLPRATQED